MTNMITIIDYGVGNLKSLCNALKHLNISYRVTSKPEEVFRADKLILPGVGAFGYAMQCLNNQNLTEVVLERTKSGSPILGICLGMQLLFSRSAEGGGCEGLDMIPGSVRRFQGSLKVPHTGWNEVEFCGDSPLVVSSSKARFAYFVHSYYCQPDEPATIIGRTNYGIDFCSIVMQENIFGAQFHPEKSQEFGLTLLEKFEEI